MNTKVIYTSIFGSEYHLHEPDVKLDGWDFYVPNVYYQ